MPQGGVARHGGSRWAPRGWHGVGVPINPRGVARLGGPDCHKRWCDCGGSHWHNGVWHDPGLRLVQGGVVRSRLVQGGVARHPVFRLTQGGAAHPGEYLLASRGGVLCGHGVQIDPRGHGTASWDPIVTRVWRDFGSPIGAEGPGGARGSRLAQGQWRSPWVWRFPGGSDWANLSWDCPDWPKGACRGRGILIVPKGTWHGLVGRNWPKGVWRGPG